MVEVVRRLECHHFSRTRREYVDYIMITQKGTAMGGIRLQEKEPVWFGCFYIFLLPQTMLPSNDKYANQSCCFGQHKMATLFGVVEKYTRNQFQLSESVPLRSYVEPA